MHEGKVIEFNQLPLNIKLKFYEEYRSDKLSQHVIKFEFNITNDNEAFKQFRYCRYGSYDNNPDFIEGKLQKAEFNNVCRKLNCPGRGIVCKNPKGLKNYEVDTLRLLSIGKTIKEISKILFISVSGLKSRLKTIYFKLNANNKAQAISIASELGIK